MAKNSRTNRTPKTIPIGIAFSLLGSIVITLLGCAVLALLIDGSVIGEETIGYGVMLTLLTASVVGSWVSSILAQHKRLLVCAISAVAYFSFLLACNALFFSGQYQGVWVTLLLIIAGSMSVCLLGLRGANGHISGRRKIRNR